MREINPKYRLVPLVAMLLWGVACFLFFQLKMPYHFFYQEQNQLFLMDWEYVGSYLDKQAWAARLVGDFLTQYYYYLYAGAAILTTALLLLSMMVYFNMRRRWDTPRWLALVVALAMSTVVARLSLYEEFRLSGVVALVGCAALRMVYVVAYKRVTRWIRLLVALPLVALAVWMFVFPCKVRWVDFDKVVSLERNFAYDTEYYFGHYQKVIYMYENETAPKTEEMCFFYCLSLAQCDILPDRLMTMKNPVLGTFYKIGPDTPLYTIKMINELYYLLGDMTYTERAALLANTFSPEGRNVRMVKRLAEVNLINDDIPAAKKYLRLLGKTAIHRKWAEKRLFLVCPAACDDDGVRQEVERKRQFVNTSDNIRVGDDCYTILTQLLESNPRNTVALDFLLCSDIVARQRDVFMRDYEKYGPRDKLLYHQALNNER